MSRPIEAFTATSITEILSLKLKKEVSLGATFNPFTSRWECQLTVHDFETPAELYKFLEKLTIDFATVGSC